MKKRTGSNPRRALSISLSLLTGFIFLNITQAAADGNMPSADNQLYLKECGSCHNAFLPGLLPGNSWERIMDGLEKHFGEDASIDKKDADSLRGYLTENAADRIRAKRSRKIMRSLSRGDSPIRITEVPYIIRKHRELNPEIFKRKEIRTFSNCYSCHPEGSRGNFEEDFVIIPGDNYGTTSLSGGAAKISVSEAMDLAKKQYPGDVIEVELERGLYEIKIRTQSGARIKVFVDPTDGKLLDKSIKTSRGGRGKGYGRGYRGDDDDHSGNSGGYGRNSSYGNRRDSDHR